MRTVRRSVRALSTLLAATAMVLGLAGVAQASPDTPDFGPSIDAYAANDAQDTCDPTAKPGVVGFRSLLNSAYGTHTGYITRACDEGDTSEHKEGRALDYMLDINDSADLAVANDVLSWLLATDKYGNKHANARRLGIMYIIWNRHIWGSYAASSGWRDYSGSNPHTDHIHFSFSWAGARKQTTWWTAEPRNRSVNDFDGDGTSDLVLYRPSADQWHIASISRGVQLYGSYPYGGGGDIPQVGDFDGDGTDDIALFRPSAGQWHIMSISRRVQLFGSYPYGGGGDIPRTGDFDNDGYADIALFRPSTGQWHIMSVHRGVQLYGSYEYGGNGDIPLTGDYDGDGYADIALFRPSTAQWHIKSVKRGVQITGSHPYGGGTDKPVWVTPTV